MMTSEERLADVLRTVLMVPTDTMITLDFPLLLTKLSRVPAIPGKDVAGTTPSEDDREQDA